VVCGPPLEIRVEEGFFDYVAKYQGTSNALHLAGDLPPGVLERLQETAVRAFDALGCVGLARVDFFVVPGDSQDEIVVNEVNTFPGFSARSQYPLIWASAGLPFPELLTLMLETALVTGRRDGLVGAS
jgi:D-alanine-D-alanine ligase